MIYNFQIKKYRKEDNWTSGETGEIYEKDFDVQIESDNLKNAFIKFWNQYCKIPDFDYTKLSTFVKSLNFIFCARTENENEEYPSEDELKEWKSGKINLFASTFEIRIKNQDLSTLNLRMVE